MPTTPILGLPYPAAGDLPDGPAQIRALAEAVDPIGAAAVPVGAMMMWAAGVAPANWMLSQGQQVDAATYPKLAAVLGAVAGKVTLPDMRDRFPVGASAAVANGSLGGTAAVALTPAQMPAHNHGGVTGGMNAHNPHGHVTAGFVAGGAGGFGAGSAYSGSPLVSSNTDIEHGHSIPSQGNGDTHENRPPYRALNFIIRVA